MHGRNRQLLGALPLLLLACNGGPTERTGASRAALASGETVQVAWGAGPNAVGFRPAVRERAALGAPALAVGPGGRIYVLDAVRGRVVRLEGPEVVSLAEVPKDSDDLAIGPDGAFAVRRSVKPEVLVFGPGGERVGAVDTSAVESVDGLALGLSRRVSVTTPFQEIFLLGSPAAPQLAGQIWANKREGAALVSGGRGVVAVRREDGELELHVVSQGEAEGRVVARHALGKGTAARIVGASGEAVCVRVEHVSEGTGGAVAVEREAACLDAATGATLLRTKLPPPGTYVPRRELAFSGRTLAFAHPTEDGLSVTTWAVEGGAR